LGLKVAWSLRGSIGSQKGPGMVPCFVLLGVAKMSSAVVLRNKFAFEEAWSWCFPRATGVGWHQGLCGVSTWCVIEKPGREQGAFCAVDCVWVEFDNRQV
jgi:hypothetical protein